MDQRDLEAMRRAIATLQADPERRDSVEGMLQKQGEQAAGLFAVGLLQVRNLRLKPWECPPCDTYNVKDPSDCYGQRPNEVRLLQRMLAAGVSRYDPNPMQAITAAEARPAA